MVTDNPNFHHIQFNWNMKYAWYKWLFSINSLCWKQNLSWKCLEEQMFKWPKDVSTFFKICHRQVPFALSRFASCIPSPPYAVLSLWLRPTSRSQPVDFLMLLRDVNRCLRLPLLLLNFPSRRSLWSLSPLTRCLCVCDLILIRNNILVSNYKIKEKLI